jgi:hypothetical protein
VRKIVGTIHVIGIGVAARVILVGETPKPHHPPLK